VKAYTVFKRVGMKLNYDYTFISPVKRNTITFELGFTVCKWYNLCWMMYIGINCPLIFIDLEYITSFLSFLSPLLKIFFYIIYYRWIITFWMKGKNGANQLTVCTPQLQKILFFVSCSPLMYWITKWEGFLQRIQLSQSLD